MLATLPFIILLFAVMVLASKRRLRILIPHLIFFVAYETVIGFSVLNLGVRKGFWWVVAGIGLPVVHALVLLIIALVVKDRAKLVAKSADSEPGGDPLVPRAQWHASAPGSPAAAAPPVARSEAADRAERFLDDASGGELEFED
ncbi:MAG: hypothetical protein AAF998_15430 [Bacteroidota bacterium]